MNKQFLKHIAFAVLLSLPVIGGCKPADNPASVPTGTNAVAGSSGTAANTNAASAGEPLTRPAVAEPVQPEVPFAVDRPIPENLSVTPPLKEVIKLAQAGVDEEVLLSFVNNATGGFQLGADEIIYLTDIGVPGTVINSMMERDKTLKVAHASVMTSVAPAPAANSAPAVAAAPSYAEAPAAAQTEAAAESMDANVNENSFDDALSPYGTWIDVEGYGRCWQPTVVVVNRNWRPYCDGGRWVYTDVGWYWYSDYSWGWAPFHYGRWFSHPRWGWCWAPDYTWGPAWVTWSYTDSYCGWAPLPPAAVYTGVGFTYCGSSVSVGFGFGLGYSCYSYVPWSHFCDYRPWRYCAPLPQCRDIHDHAVCHNDYGNDRNHRAVNRGLPPERVRAFTRSEIRRVNLRDVSEVRPAPGRREELTRDGRTLEIRHPAGPTTATVAGAGAIRTAATRSAESVVSTTPQGNSVPRNLPPARPNSPAEPTLDSAGQVNPPTRHAENPGAQPSRSRAARPLVVVGNGDGRPPTPSTWNPYQNPSQPVQREELAEASTTADGSSAQPNNAPARHANQPTRPEVSTPSQVIRVGRGIEDRPVGSPNYRVYSSPQREAPSTPGYGLPPTVNVTVPSPSHARPTSRSNDDDNNGGGGGSPNYQPSRPPTYESPRQSERAVERNAPQRPVQAESRPAPTESRPAPAPAPAPSRSEPSRSDSRPSDSSRGNRDR